jgi:microcystin-dependent protein
LGSALPVASGGTGGTSITANSVVLGNGTGALGGNLVAPGASGNLLTSNGTTWTSAAAPTSFVSGMLMPYAGSSAPTGWLLCYGQAVSRTTYSSLFSAIGSTYGSGDGSTTFNVPDFRGRIAAGQDNMGGSAASRLTTAVSGVDGTTVGASGGDQRQQSHTHTATDSGHTHQQSYVTFANPATTGGGAAYGSTTTTTGTGYANISVSTTGAGSSQNVQPTLVVTYIIKT